jgi:uncharacterized lipoprotein YmbA
MYGFRGRVSPALCAIALIGLTACSSVADTKFYILTPLPASQKSTDNVTGRPTVIALRPINLPEQLDRLQIVTRVGENRLHVAESDHWGAPLRESFARVLAEDLSVLVPGGRVLLFPWGRETQIDYDVFVDVLRFDGTLGGESTLVADWTIRRLGSERIRNMSRSTLSEPAGESYTTLVLAESRLIAALGRDIAAALKAMPARAGKTP